MCEATVVDVNRQLISLFEICIRLSVKYKSIKEILFHINELRLKPAYFGR